ncbi:AAA family ATPase [Brevibacillus brevis]|uniref:Nuclease SbcCD subunit C n=1 Tax=Brevibacillus brevis TaxID=1393 RepID=A0ABY9T4X0_BREBE|nr:AAA family ATPase [Brevibacillus brevis]WNC15151.1 hypothetical protein RGB73_01885 [Brevibacillus brevis]
MNNRLIKLIRDCGLNFVRKHHLRGEVYEATHRWQGVTLGKYILIPMELDDFLGITANHQEYEKFEEQVLAPFYFQLKGDWSWNLYLCLILEEEDLQRVPLERMVRVERGKRYGKKLIVAWSDLAKRLPTAKLPTRMDGQIAADPLKDWEQALVPAGLGFCLQDYREALVEQYLNDSLEPIPPELHTETTADLPQKPSGPIRMLHFGEEYRSHFLSRAPSLEFAQVNLLSGPNGMGKTSVLECIELAFTGAIQRNLLADSEMRETWDGQMTFWGDDRVFSGMPSEQEKKEREIAYYRQKVAPKARSQINRMFHQYNYFSSEAVHQFCFNHDNPIDYRTAFARVIYGEQLERVERRWTQYKEEMQKRFNRISRTLANLEAQLGEQQSEQTRETELMRARAAAKRSAIAKWMKNCHYAYPILEEDTGLSEVEAWLQHLEPRLTELEIVSRPLIHPELGDIQNGSRVRSALVANREAQDSCQNQKNEVTEQLKTLSSAGKLSEQQNALSLLMADHEKLRDQYLQLARELQSKGELFDQSTSRDRRKWVQKRLTDLQDELMEVETVLRLYGDLTGVQLALADENDARNQMDEAEARWEHAKQQYQEAMARTKAQREHASLLQRLASEIKADGRRYLEANPEESRCPMCGHDHAASETLLHAIERGIHADDEWLTKLLEEEEESRVRMQDHQQVYEHAKERYRLWTRWQDLHAYLRDYKDRLALEEIPEAFDFASLQRALKACTEQLERKRAERQRLEQEAQELDRRGIGLKMIAELDALLETPLISSVREELGPEATGPQLVLGLEKRAEWHHQESKKAREELAKAEELIRQAENQRIELSRRMEELEEQEKELSRARQHLVSAEKAFERLRELNVHLSPEHSWPDWRSYLEQLVAECSSLADILRPRLLLEQQEGRALELKGQIKSEKERLHRCERALDVLSGLKPLADYGDEFVRSNFEAISQLFVALHAPNEFESLQWNESNQIVAKRKGHSLSCTINQMSTGQRTTVILAVFFVMHLVMDTAPKIIMLDEPVANMDELNVLGLLDFLRQMTITNGTQIFFTTANPQVATLFRRKFSFLQERFQAFQLQRYPEGPVRIKIQSFAPDKELAVNIQQL